ncbi:precorrin-4 C(11)-methyltransferase [Desulfococcus sp.]|uniref:precorrin-4 C(11)-methyltransferase n=1 Tax=Desulfococcus sp. TaxID=2025834 RepID=UPI0035939C81
MKTHPITFVGAGPGDPELITVKGMKAVQEADLVVYAGSLVPEALLQWASPECLVENSAEMHLDEIVSTMAGAHRSGKRVVRLHTGDPSLYGAIAEQITELEKRGIPFRVIPGVTAAFAAAAAMGLEFTLPEVSQTLILTRMAGRTPVPEAEALASLAEHRASMAVYLSIAMIDRVAEVLKKTYGEDAPAAIAYRVSQPDERIFRTTVGGLPDLVRKENIRKTALILVGDALNQGVSGTDPKSRLYDRAFTHEYRRGEG